MAIFRRAVPPIAIGILAAVLAACSATGTAPSVAPGASAASTAPAASGGGVCEDVTAVRTALTDLKGLDLKTAGKAGLTTAIDKVDASITTLTSSAKDAAGPQVDALKASIATLKAALQNLTSDASVVEKASDIRAATTGVEDAATALKAALTQCS